MRVVSLIYHSLARNLRQPMIKMDRRLDAAAKIVQHQLFVRPVGIAADTKPKVYQRDGECALDKA